MVSMFLGITRVVPFPSSLVPIMKPGWVGGVRVEGVKSAVHAVGAVIDMQVTATFQKRKYAHVRASPVFKIP